MSSPSSTTFLATWREPGETAVNTAWQEREKGADLCSAIERGLAACELDPRYLAIGLGSLPNADGELELDAAMMEGRYLNAGAVCAVRGIAPVISVARLVMESTPHVMLAGDQARRFAIANGHRPRNLVTEEVARRYEDWRNGLVPDEYIHTTAEASHADTVTMLALEQTAEGAHVEAASATSGLAWKLPGRVGDSPIIGAGIYADDEVGCAGATGLGEELWKACASFRTVEAMRRGLDAQAACEETIRHMLRRQRDAARMACVVLALGKNGDYGSATTEGTFHLWVMRDGVSQVHEHHALR